MLKVLTNSNEYISQIMAEQEQPAASDHNQEAVNAFHRMKELGHGMDAAQATRTARRLSKWANPNHAQ